MISGEGEDRKGGGGGGDRKGDGRGGKESLFPDHHYRIKMCPYLKKGECKNGENCKFAHSSEELRPPPSSLTKTKMCPHFLEGTCALSRDLCPLAHGEEDLREEPNPSSAALCLHWYTHGWCAQGSLCKHAHDLSELRPRRYRLAELQRRARRDEVDLQQAIEEQIERRQTEAPQPVVLARLPNHALRAAQATSPMQAAAAPANATSSSSTQPPYNSSSCSSSSTGAFVPTASTSMHSTPPPPPPPVMPSHGPLPSHAPFPVSLAPVVPTAAPNLLPPPPPPPPPPHPLASHAPMRPHVALRMPAGSGNVPPMPPPPPPLRFGSPVPSPRDTEDEEENDAEESAPATIQVRLNHYASLRDYLAALDMPRLLQCLEEVRKKKVREAKKREAEERKAAAAAAAAAAAEGLTQPGDSHAGGNNTTGGPGAAASSWRNGASSSSHAHPYQPAMPMGDVMLPSQPVAPTVHRPVTILPRPPPREGSSSSTPDYPITSSLSRAMQQQANLNGDGGGLTGSSGPAAMSSGTPGASGTFASHGSSSFAVGVSGSIPHNPLFSSGSVSVRVGGISGGAGAHGGALRVDTEHHDEQPDAAAARLPAAGVPSRGGLADSDVRDSAPPRLSGPGTSILVLPRPARGGLSASAAESPPGTDGGISSNSASSVSPETTNSTFKGGSGGTGGSSVTDRFGASACHSSPYSSSALAKLKGGSSGRSAAGSSEADSKFTTSAFGVAGVGPPSSSPSGEKRVGNGDGHGKKTNERDGDRNGNEEKTGGTANSNVTETG
uniref:C3H1-type domain-containing protein n=1 Tax=Chromera velia CCMP2878 TaxID=1169474 RepID=A0A0G4I582_9ALVE|eukprot:Cvel_1836.t1-p1 / transcript=Cvel_1836.t1 / gene=Cvel_1836 / organism=Chromera_velia_CCMP2878 / gene_product=hypothetical protein / transcript_product=hypothetical protein / location=Cvel_scaffold67:140339-144368(-) / protein_length=779 / sequence_SO=supercontig / SO=protein_coding / is_pseudo=false